MAAGVAAPRTGPARAAPPIDLASAAKGGALFGVAAAFAGAVGMLQAFDERLIIGPWISLSDTVLLLLGLGAGLNGGKQPPALEGYEAAPPGPRNIAAGAVAGAVGGLVFGLFAVVLSAVDGRGIFVAFTPVLRRIVTLDQSTGLALLLLIGWGAVLGVLGGALQTIPQRIKRAVTTAITTVVSVGILQVIVGQVLDGIQLDVLGDRLYRGGSGGMTLTGAVALGVVAFALHLSARGKLRGAPDRFRGMQKREQRMAAVALMVVTAFLLGALPHVLGNFISAVLGTAGAFLLMALGLNIVIGFAGLLDLGYVAFFAVGAYTTAVLTSPTAPAFSPELIFWLAIPFVLMAAAVAGVVVGAPVLRMRGDYLAIVTLGFGEIARLIVQSDWQKPTLGGAQGIKNIPAISVGGFEFISPESFFYLVLAFAVLFTYITYSLQQSRLGRAWNAMREDEAVAEVMGVNVVTAKLWAFVLGAIMASLGGALFATKVTSVFPNDFDIVVSITVVVIVIVGGMGSVPGVLLASFVLIGLPELLREFSEFRFLLYGILLILMMLKRPEGFIPSRRRQRELHEDERSQDAWLARAAEEQAAEDEAADAASGPTPGTATDPGEGR